MDNNLLDAPPDNQISTGLIGEQRWIFLHDVKLQSPLYIIVQLSETAGDNFRAAPPLVICCKTGQNPRGLTLASLEICRPDQHKRMLTSWPLCRHIPGADESKGASLVNRLVHRFT